MPTAAQIIGQKELILLWMMITSGVDRFNPAVTDAAKILGNIERDYNANRRGGAGGWKWDYLTPTHANTVVTTAVGSASSYDTVGTNFRNDVAGMAAATSWPVTEPTHPLVPEVMVALGLT